MHVHSAIWSLLRQVLRGQRGRPPQTLASSPRRRPAGRSITIMIIIIIIIITITITIVIIIIVIST